MTGDVLLVAPSWWAPLKDALVAAFPDGENRVHSLLGGTPSYRIYEQFLDAQAQRNAFVQELESSLPGAVDVMRAVYGIQPEPIITELVEKLPHQLGIAWTVRRLINLIAQSHPLKAVATTCTWDVFGRAAAAGAADVNVPLIHVLHASPATRPEDSLFFRETPGDLVLAQGERDVEWVRRTGSSAPVLVAGNPFFDQWAKVRRPVRPLGHVPVVCFSRQSGANEWQSPACWQSRDVPHEAWRFYLGAVEHLGKSGFRFQAAASVRPGEDPDLVARWQEELRRVAEGAGVPWSFTDTDEGTLLRDVDLTVGLDTNLGALSLGAGVPHISITRDGQELFNEDGSVRVLRFPSPSFGMDLAAAIEHGLTFDWKRSVLREEAAFYNAGIDGRATERVCAVIRDVVDFGLAHVLEPQDAAVESRELVEAL